MSPAPLRLTVALSAAELRQLAAGGGEIVMQASSAHAVVFEVAVVLREAPQAAQEGPQQPAPVPAAPRPPKLYAAAVPPGSRYVPTEQDTAEAHAAAERIERERRELGYTAP